MFTMLKPAATAAVLSGTLFLAGTTTAEASIDVGSLGAPLNQTGSMALTASAPSSRIVINGLALNCQINSYNLSFNTGGYASPFPRSIGAVQPVLGSVATPCVGPSGYVYTFTCASTSQLHVDADVPISTGPPAIWDGSITGIDCTYSFPLLACSATLSGSTQITFTNPTATADARLTVLTAGQSLTISGSTCPSDIIPNGTARFGGTGAGATGITNLIYTVTGATNSQPFITPTTP